MVVVNEEEFHSETQRAFDDYRLHGVTTTSPNRYIFGANRRLLNYLTAMRFFLDFSNSRVTRRFGSKIQERLQFQEACANAFDEVFAYRFTYKLRNFSQHCGLPIGVLSLDADLDEATNTTNHNFSIHFDPKSLLEEYDSWGKVKVDLEKLDQHLLVNPLLSEMTNELQKLSVLTIQFDYNEAKLAGEKIVRVLQGALELGGVPALGDFTPGDSDQHKFELEWPPLRMLEHLKLLSLK